MYKYILIALSIILIYIIICNGIIRDEVIGLYKPSVPVEAIACFRNTRDCSGITGTVKMYEDLDDKETVIDVELEGIADGKHGFHIHTSGDLSQGCKSACDHYNPFGVTHGSLDDGHVGDLGNIVSKNGTVRQQIRSKAVKLRGKYSVIGRTVVIHEFEDDLGNGVGIESKKTGNSGSRIGCAVIGLC